MIFIYLCKYLTSHCGPTLSRGSWFKQNFKFTTSGCFIKNYSFSGLMVFTKEELKTNYRYIPTYKKYRTRNWNPTLPPRNRLWPNLNQHYWRLLPKKIQLFLSNSFCEEIVSINTNNMYILLFSILFTDKALY